MTDAQLAVTVTLPVLIYADTYDETLDELLDGIEEAARRAGVTYVQPVATRGIAAEYSDAL